jgi:hypothetical protein
MALNLHTSSHVNHSKKKLIYKDTWMKLCILIQVVKYNFYAKNVIFGAPYGSKPAYPLPILLPYSMNNVT